MVYFSYRKTGYGVVLYINDLKIITTLKFKCNFEISYILKDTLEVDINKYKNLLICNILQCIESDEIYALYIIPSNISNLNNIIIECENISCIYKEDLHLDKKYIRCNKYSHINCLLNLTGNSGEGILTIYNDTNYYPSRNNNELHSLKLEIGSKLPISILPSNDDIEWDNKTISYLKQGINIVKFTYLPNYISLNNDNLSFDSYSLIGTYVPPETYGCILM